MVLDSPKERKHIKHNGQLSPGVPEAEVWWSKGGPSPVSRDVWGRCFSGNRESARQHLATLLCSASGGSCEQTEVSNGVPSLTGGSAAKGAGLRLAEVPGSKFEWMSESGRSVPTLPMSAQVPAPPDKVTDNPRALPPFPSLPRTQPQSMCGWIAFRSHIKFISGLQLPLLADLVRCPRPLTWGPLPGALYQARGTLWLLLQKDCPFCLRPAELT